MMRPMSLQSDLEAEMWVLLHELVFRHNLSSEDAYARLRNAADKTCRAWEDEWRTSDA